MGLSCAFFILFLEMLHDPSDSRVYDDDDVRFHLSCGEGPLKLWLPAGVEAQSIQLVQQVGSDRHLHVTMMSQMSK